MQNTATRRNTMLLHLGDAVRVSKDLNAVVAIVSHDNKAVGKECQANGIPKLMFAVAKR